ncbi:heterokaryon incompatibility protein-domain-containing protein [Xylaria curta]|nr:heterokaryon incompatibility protein-domain-containing protein [Xylaria curta]
MHLLNVRTRQLQEFIGNSIPPYAILSHTWGEDEVLFQDLSTPEHKEKLGYHKIEGCCQQAIDDGINFVWIDTCCIDKKSSAELSEAINSMFRWYGEAQVCYVYLVDVLGIVGSDELYSTFRHSKWFTRGWTLQELIAPTNIRFLDTMWLTIYYINKESYSDWNNRNIYNHMIEEITGIRRWYNYAFEKLNDKERYTDVPIATKLSWASGRRTARVEDMAYCLLGLLEISMPLLYGEGHKAFLRLQEEFLKKHHDPTILCRGFRMDYLETQSINSAFGASCLAPTPLLFRGFRNVTPRKTYIVRPPQRMGWTVTPGGLHIELPIVQVDTQNNVYLGMTNYCDSENRDTRLVIPIYKVDGSDIYAYASTCGPFFLSRVGKVFNLAKLKEHLKTIYLDNSPPPLSSEPSGGPILRMGALFEAGFVLDSVYPPTSKIGRDYVECPNNTPF